MSFQHEPIDWWILGTLLGVAAAAAWIAGRRLGSAIAPAAGQRRGPNAPRRRRTVNACAGAVLLVGAGWLAWAAPSGLATDASDAIERRAPSDWLEHLESWRLFRAGAAERARWREADDASKRTGDP